MRRYLKIFSFLLLIFGFSQTALAFQPNDTQLPQQQYLHRIRAFEGWEFMTPEAKARPIVIAVLDTGVDINHPDLADAIWTNSKEIPDNNIDDDNNSFIDDVHGWNFVEANNDVKPQLIEGFLPEAVNHGTIIAGIIAAGFDNGRGIAGLVPNAQIMPIRALDSQGNGNTLVLAQAIDYAVENGASIINLSLVGRQIDPDLAEAIRNAYNHNVAIVAAAGNEEKVGDNLNFDPHYPVCEVDSLNRVLGVAALNLDNSLSTFSNYGSNCIDVSAPGTGIFSSVVFAPEQKLTEYYSGGWSGTSVASPIVAGVLADMKKVAPKLRLEQLYDILIHQAKSLESSNPTIYPQLGGGIVDMAAALEQSLKVNAIAKPVFVIGGLSGNSLITQFQDDSSITNSWYAYDKSFQVGTRLASLQPDADGVSLIVTAPARNAGPHIRVYTANGQLHSQFMAYDSRFRGGLSLATGDFDGDGRDEIVTVPSSGGGPHVRVFDLNGQLISQFMAYDSRFKGGVQVATADIDDDGVPEIITLPLDGGSAHVRIFDYKGTIKKQFMAYDAKIRGQLSFAVGDLNNDHEPDITVTLHNDQQTEVRTLTPQGDILNSWLLFAKLQQKSYPVQILVQDVTGDLRDDLVVYPQNEKGEKILQIFDFTGVKVKDIAMPAGISAGNSLIVLPQ